jgi:hypothetical protein
MMKICPIASEWAKLHKELLKYSEKNECSPSNPPKPLILAGWVHSSDQDKKERWQETIAWARSNGCSDLLDRLIDDVFYTVGER